MMKNEFLTLRANILGGMDDYIRNVLGDDFLTEIWNERGIEDGIDEDTLMEVAEDDDLWRDICYTFGNLIVGYNEDSELIKQLS
jgi:hypothetical protein